MLIGMFFAVSFGPGVEMKVIASNEFGFFSFCQKNKSRQTELTH